MDEFEITLQREFFDEIRFLRLLGVHAPVEESEKQLKKLAIRFNHGLARKVSLKRPSPKLSRKKFEAFHAQSRVDAIDRRGGTAGRRPQRMIMMMIS